MLSNLAGQRNLHRESWIYPGLVELSLGFLCYISGVIQVNPNFYIRYHLVKSNEGVFIVSYLGNMWYFPFLLQCGERDATSESVGYCLFLLGVLHDFSFTEKVRTRKYSKRLYQRLAICRNNMEFNWSIYHWHETSIWIGVRSAIGKAVNLITRGWCCLLLGTSWNTPRIRRGLQRSYRGTSYPRKGFWQSCVFRECCLYCSTVAYLGICKLSRNLRHCLPQIQTGVPPVTRGWLKYFHFRWKQVFQHWLSLWSVWSLND